jgi:hypothetical protein
LFSCCIAYRIQTRYSNRLDTARVWFLDKLQRFVCAIAGEQPSGTFIPGIELSDKSRFTDNALVILLNDFSAPLNFVDCWAEPLHELLLTTDMITTLAWHQLVNARHPLSRALSVW